MIRGLLLNLLIVGAIVFSGCSNELDLTAPYKDTTIVYGLLSPTDSVQYIKIYKAFIGDGNAFEFAQQADSFYFKDILIVQLLRMKQGVTLDTINMSRDTLSPMTDGVFAYAPNVVYSTTEPIDINSTYKLNIYNKQSGTIVTAETIIPDKASLIEPNSVSNDISLVSAPEYNINWESGFGAKAYSVVMRFYYEEITSADTVPKYVDWMLGNKTVKNQNITEYLELLKNKDAFYKNLETKLAIPDSQTYRKAGLIELIFAGAAEDYYYYKKINNASVGVSQSIPSYTNITNGIGIFSAKYVSKWSFDLDNASHNYLRTGPYTNRLKFN